MAFIEQTQIRTYEDLINAKKELRSTLKKQEVTFLNNPVINISSSLFGGNSLKEALKTPLASISRENIIKTAESILSTFLLANRKTRGIYIGYVIAKEMIPFTLIKVNEMLNKK